MTPLLAHQGGWDEILLTAALVLLMLGVSRWRRGRDAPVAEPATLPDRAAPPPADRCAYCEAALEPAAERCSACGFRVDGATGG